MSYFRDWMISSLIALLLINYASPETGARQMAKAVKAYQIEMALP